MNIRQALKDDRYANARRALAAGLVLIAMIWAKSFADGEVVSHGHETPAPAPHAAAFAKWIAPHPRLLHPNAEGATFSTLHDFGASPEPVAFNPDGVIGPDYGDAIGELADARMGDGPAAPQDGGFFPQPFAGGGGVAGGFGSFGGGGGGGGGGNGGPSGPGGSQDPHDPHDPQNNPGPDHPYNPISGNPVAAVPEPATWAMFLFGFGAIGFAMRTSRRRQHGAATTA